MNIDFSAHPAFSCYVLLLMAAGIISLVLASPGFARAGMKLRVLNAIVGLAMLCYGIYLAFIFGGGTYLIVYKAFAVPVILIIATVRSIVAKRSPDAVAPRPAVAEPIEPDHNAP